MLSFYLIWPFLYLFLLWLLSRSWRSADFSEKGINGYLKPSLVIAFRNEFEILPSLVLEIQKIKNAVLEVILIDDHSEDGSFEFLQSSFENDSKIRILKSNGIGKKAAITTGVLAARSELILCSDADCEFNEKWPETICASFQIDSIQLVAGPVLSESSGSFFSKFQQIEWSSILLVTNHFFKMDKPLMCSAANLAYRKSAFLAVNGFEGNQHHLSGDDEFLLKKVVEKFGVKSLDYLTLPNALVMTRPQFTWKSFLQQRIRWASKWRAHASWSHIVPALGSFGIQLFWIGSIWLLTRGIEGVILFLVVWVSKILAEYIALNEPLKTYRMVQIPIDFIRTSVIHPFFVIWVGLNSLSGKFVWKGRGQ